MENQRTDNNSEQIAGFSKTRSRLGIVCVIVLVLVNIYSSWSRPEKQGAKSSSDLVSKTQEEFIFELQTKTVVGGIVFLSELEEKYPAQAQISQELIPEIRKTFGKSLEAVSQQFLKDPKIAHSALAKLAIVNLHFSEFDQNSKIISKLEEKSPETYSNFTTLIKELEQPTKSKPNSANNFFKKSKPKLEKELGWFYKLLADIGSSDSQLAKQAKQEARDSFVKICLGGTLAVCFFTISVLSILILIGIGLVKKSSFAKIDLKHSDYGIEIFALYLLYMFLTPKIIELFSPNLTPEKGLALNAILILGALVVLLWPKLSGKAHQYLRTLCALPKRHPMPGFRDVLFGAMTYSAAWIPLLVILVIYSFALQTMGVDVSQGAHPLVPILTKSGNSTIIIWSFLLAVFAAPIVEEVMFRGALYTWLRKYLGAGSTITISSLIFAAVHPQGAIGIVPLFSIGAVLGFLREWRGNIKSCMVAHALFNLGTLVLVVLLFR